MKKISLLIALMFFGAGCASQTSQVSTNLPSQNEQDQDQPGDISINSQIVMKGNDIYFSGVKRGEIVGQTVNLGLGENLFVSFPGKVGDFWYSGHGRPEEADATMINSVTIKGLNLTVSDFVAAPYQLYEPVDAISYQCDGSLVKLASSGAGVPNFYCETNGKDSLSQYEFSSAGIGDFATGDTPSINWQKVYIKKAGDKNVFIFVNLGSVESDASVIGNETAKVAAASKKAYLDAILAKPDVVQRLKLADEFVKNLTVTVEK
ncbi:MAG: hypothetical protein WCJ29_04595 [bacterium]